MAKKMTIENLAEIVQKGFKESDIRTDKKIDDLAAIVNRGFECVGKEMTEIRNTMATKEDLHEVQDILSNAIKDLEMRMSAYMSFNKEELDRLKSWMQTIEERVAFLEQKYKHKK